MQDSSNFQFPVAVITKRGTKIYPMRMRASGTEITHEIQRHYDVVSPLYRTFWGHHLHHGYWEKDESQAVAQENLVRRLVAMARIPSGADVLDIGCGIGGSAVWLARELGCTVVGLTLSSVQVRLARRLAKSFQVEGRTRFDTADANEADFGDSRFDAVWIVESSEHILDKAGFLAKAARALKPGGVLALCAWVRADRLSSPDQSRLVQQICDGMLCPGLASTRAYTGWMKDCSLEVIAQEDCTQNVRKTWDLCTALLNRSEVRRILQASAHHVRQFAASFDAMRQAYATGAMGYLMLAARKPGSSKRVATAEVTMQE
jgi:tocopherol O-methyltransferase